MSPRAKSSDPGRDVLAPPRRPRRRRTATAAVALAGLASTVLGAVGPAAPEAAAAGDGICVTSGLSTTCTFPFTGAPQQWVVPAGVRSATFQVVGASGGVIDVPPSPGDASRGGGVEATVRVVPGSTMQIYVGGHGDDYGGDGGAGGWNGGGNGGGAEPHGAGGGGASDVRIAPYGLGMRILVGGGGGGQGAPAFYWGGWRPGWGGDGGGSTGGGAGPGGRGDNGGDKGYTSGGGGGGTLNPGSGGLPSPGQQNLWCRGETSLAGPGRRGSLGVGGDGGYPHVFGTPERCDGLGGWGGGGGGGYTGGGGGGAGISGGAGGGGGSGFGPGTSTTFLGEPLADGVVRVTYLSPSTTGWVPLGGGLASAPTISARPATGLVDAVQDVFYLNEQSHVMHRTLTSGVLGPEEDLGGAVYPGSTVAAVSYAFNRIDVFARSAFDGLIHRSYDGRAWSPEWDEIRTETRITSSPTVASWGPRRLDVFARGADRELLHTWSDDAIGFAPFETFPGSLVAAPAAVSWGSNRIDILAGNATPAGTQLQQMRWDGGWAGWFTFFTDLGLTSAPTISSAGVGMLDIYYRNAANGLSRRSYDYRTGWAPTVDAGPVPSPPGSTPAVASLTTGQRIVLLRGNDNTLQARIYP